MTTFIANWPTTPSVCRVLADGREQVGGVIIPPFRVLEKHALSIVRGEMLADRLGGWDAVWEPEEEPLHVAVADNPGMLHLEQDYSKSMSYRDRHGALRQPDNMGFMQWSITWRIAADADSFGASSWFMTPSQALARMIALCEDHEREVRAGMVEHCGGLA